MMTRASLRGVCVAIALLNFYFPSPGTLRAASEVGRVVVVLDATSTMTAPCGTMSRFDVARWCLSDVLDLTPSGTPFCFAIAGNGGYRIEPYDAMSPSIRSEIRRNVMRINPQGTTSQASCFTDPRLAVNAMPNGATTS